MLKNKEAIFKLFILNLHLKYFKLTEYYGRNNGPPLILVWNQYIQNLSTSYGGGKNKDVMKTIEIKYNRSSTVKQRIPQNSLSSLKKLIKFDVSIKMFYVGMQKE